jgi:hypothetical protein
MPKLEAFLSVAFVIFLAVVLAVGFLVSLFVTPAEAQANCAPRPVVVERLADRYGETRRSVGLGANNAVVEVFASDESGSWTIIVTTPGGLTCLVASGQAYEAVSEALPEKGEEL